MHYVLQATIILADFNLAVSNPDHQTAKFNSHHIYQLYGTSLLSIHFSDALKHMFMWSFSYPDSFGVHTVRL